MAVDIFLRIDGITGESQNANFKGQIQLESFSFGAANVGNIGLGAGSGSGKVSFTPITVTKVSDTTSPVLFLAVCQGKRFATATVSFVRSGASAAYITFDLGTVVVSGLTTSVANGVPLDTVTLVCESVKYTVNVLNATGAVTNSVSDGWDITKNAKL